jgi:general L-amino acid transport system permease protein
MATTTGRPPLWRDVRILGWAFQLAVAAVVVIIISVLFDAYQANSERQNIPTGFDFLEQPAGFPIPGSDFRPSQPVSDAYVEGFKNTLRLVLVGIAAATVLGILLGIARLSKNFLVRSASRAYVEFVRNIPLFILLILVYTAIVLNALPRPADSWTLGPIAVVNVRGASVFWFDGGNWQFAIAVAVVVLTFAAVATWRRRVSDRTGHPARTGLWGLSAAALALVITWWVVGLGASAPELDGARVAGGITMTPEYLAAFIALVVYTSSHVAEIVRGSIQAVPKGQGEAADALALSSYQRLRFVVLPQAMRIALPPIGNQYLNLSKNSSLAAAISFPELTKVTQLTVANRSPAVPAFALLLAIYLVISLVLSLVVNLANRRLAIVER